MNSSICNWKIFICATQGAVHNSKGLIPAAYAANLVEGNAEKVFWGWGGFRDTQALFAHGISAVTDYLLLEHPDLSDQSEFPIEIVALKCGFWQRLTPTEHHEISRSNGKPDEHGAWSRLRIHKYLGKFPSPRKPQDSFEKRILSSLSKRAGVYAEAARADAAAQTVGLQREGVEEAILGSPRP